MYHLKSLASQVYLNLVNSKEIVRSFIFLCLIMRSRFWSHLWRPSRSVYLRVVLLNQAVGLCTPRWRLLSLHLNFRPKALSIKVRQSDSYIMKRPRVCRVRAFSSRNYATTPLFSDDDLLFPIASHILYDLLEEDQCLYLGNWQTWWTKEYLAAANGTHRSCHAAFFPSPDWFFRINFC